MPLNFRQTQILALAKAEGRVVVEPLALRFGVTNQTIRRDLTELCEAGRLERVYGGAILPSGVANIGYEDRRLLNSEAKDRIARLCAQAIPDAASLFLNIGTGVEAVARALLDHDNLMVVTNNMNVANTLIANPSCEVVVAGGVVRRSDGALVGDITADMVRQFKVDIAVIGASALDRDGDLLDFDFREVRVSQAVMRNARCTYLVSDHSKFGRGAPVRIASLEDVDTFFTDRPPPGSGPAVVRTVEDRNTGRPSRMIDNRLRVLGVTAGCFVRGSFSAPTRLSPLSFAASLGGAKRRSASGSHGCQPLPGAPGENFPPCSATTFGVSEAKNRTPLSLSHEPARAMKLEVRLRVRRGAYANRGTGLMSHGTSELCGLV